MTGLEKMKSQILDEAKSSASDIIDRAQKSADAVKKGDERKSGSRMRTYLQKKRKLMLRILRNVHFLPATCRREKRFWRQNRK